MEYARSVEGRPKICAMSGGKVVREFDMADEHYAYHLQLRQCDPQIIRAEAVRLFEEVISDYADVPHITHRAVCVRRFSRTPIRNGTVNR